MIFPGVLSSRPRLAWLGFWVFTIFPTMPIAIGQNSTGNAQDRQQPPSISIMDFRPVPKLKVPGTDLEHCRFPAIDVHTHFEFKTGGDRAFIERYVTEVMNPNHVAICISLDARLGSEQDHLRLLGGDLAGRFGVLVHIDFQGQAADHDYRRWACNQPQFVHTVVEQLAAAKQAGCIGVKFFKQFGLGYRDAAGNLLRIDDPRWDPIWTKCAELQMPVLIHTADPAAFFDPIDNRNERAEELLRHPDWSFFGADFPKRDELLSARNRVIERHRQTVFIGAHTANDAEDLAEVAGWLDKYPNLYVDIASRIAELGRKPRQARAFIEKYGDRILFGTDGPWVSERLHYYWRFLETSDEYFPYSEKQPLPQGNWFIYGMELDDEILEKVYYRNTLKLFPSLREKYEQAAMQLTTR